MRFSGFKLSRPLLRISFMFVAVFAIASHISAGQAMAAQATVSWAAPKTYTDGSPATNIAGYSIKIGTAPGDYSQDVKVGKTTSHVLDGLNDGTTYYFAVSAFDPNGRVSAPSSEVSFTTRTGSGSGAKTASKAGPPTAPASTPVSTATLGTEPQAASQAPAATGSIYTLTASVGGGGTITPEGAVAISAGESHSYTITPAAGYKVASVTVDGKSVGAVSSYTFSKVTADHTLTATFARI